jgi:YbbR domain-containing protein
LINSKLLSKIIEKWPAKVLSVAAALIISIFYRINTLETRFVSVPLLLESADSFIPSNSYARTVRVSLRGEANSINPILEEDIEAYIDLKKYTQEGVYRIPVQIRKKGGALGVEPLEISVVPIEVTLVLEQKTIRSIPVYPVFSGKIAEGYEMTGQSNFPSEVIAEGPRSALEAIYEFNTDTINLDGRYENFTVMANIINNNPLITIYGGRICEYRGVIRSAGREARMNIPTPDDETPDNETGESE